MCNDFYMVIAHMFFNADGPSYFAPMQGGRWSTTDDLIIQRVMWPTLCRMDVLRRNGRVLHQIHGQAPRDHMPVLMSFRYHLQKHTAGAAEQVRWGQDKLAQCLQSGVGREACTEDLAAALARAEPKLMELAELSFPDAH